jgi:hypothetical protein
MTPPPADTFSLTSFFHSASGFSTRSTEDAMMIDDRRECTPRTGRERLLARARLACLLAVRVRTC